MAMLKIFELVSASMIVLSYTFPPFGTSSQCDFYISSQLIVTIFYVFIVKLIVKFSELISKMV